MHQAADRIRNVALVGHRGAGKTSLHEAMLFEAGVTSRLGSVAAGTTVSDREPDEQARGMSISLQLATLQWQGRRINVIDTPGDPGFIADALGAMRVCESAVFVLSGVMGVEPHTQRLWQRAQEIDLARILFVNMLDRERADFFRTLAQLKAAFGPHVVATEIPIGVEQELRGVIDLVDMRAFEYDSADSGRGSGREIPIPEELRASAEEYREKLMDEVAENSDALMERYLDGEEISHEEVVAALKDGTNHGHLFPVTCGVATRSLATNRLLDAIVEDLPSPVKHGGLAAVPMTLHADEDADAYAYVFKTRSDPFAGRINLLRVYQGTVRHDTQLLNTRAHVKERIGHLLRADGGRGTQTDELGPGDIGAVAKLKQTRAGDWLAMRDEPITMPHIELPPPVMAFAIEAAGRGDEEKLFTALRRLQDEDPTLDLHRDPQTGEQIVAGVTETQVEVTVERLQSRYGVEARLHPPRVPYRETVRHGAQGHGRHKKQTGGRGQFGDCQLRLEPLASGSGFEFVNEIKGGVIPGGFIPAVEKGVVEALQHGAVAGYPVRDVRVAVFDGAYHSVDSSELAFKLAAGNAIREALAAAGPVLLEPIMLIDLTVPEEAVGEVIGDLNARRGHPQGMDSIGAGLSRIKAQVPMAELLAYAPDLRAITGGQGEYTMQLAHYEEVPSHVLGKVVAAASGERVAA